MKLLWNDLKVAILGITLWRRCISKMNTLCRHLSEPPRKRQKQCDAMPKGLIMESSS